VVALVLYVESPCLPDTMFVTEPAAVGSSTIWTVAEAPAGSVPSEHDSALPVLVQFHLAIPAAATGPAVAKSPAMYDRIVAQAPIRSGSDR
jgi:hypothetical protein